MTHQIEQAHGLEAWQKKSALQCDLQITFGDKVISQSQLIFTTDGHHVRMDRNDKTILIWDGKEAWITPEKAQEKMARFELLTWSYFIAAPFKLTDPGTHLEPMEQTPLQEKLCHRARLTFDQGIGDAPEDWYIIYQDPDSKRLRAMAYIVTYGMGKEKAEKDPHAIVYKDFVTHKGVTLATHWEFFAWSKDEGLGQKIGSAQLKNLRFVQPSTNMFTPQKSKRIDPLPSS